MLKGLSVCGIFFIYFRGAGAAGAKETSPRFVQTWALNFCYVKNSVLQAFLLNKETNKQEQNMNSICYYSKNLRRLFKTNSLADGKETLRRHCLSDNKSG